MLNSNYGIFDNSILEFIFYYDFLQLDEHLLYYCIILEVKHMTTNLSEQIIKGDFEFETLQE